MKRITLIACKMLLVVLVFEAVMASCVRGQISRHVEKPFSDSVSIVAVADKNPRRALFVIDSVQLVGSIPPYKGDIMRAHVISSWSPVMNLDSAQHLCERLVGLKEVQKNDDDLLDVLQLLVDISYKRENDEQLLHWARQLATACHRCGRTVEELRANVELGFALIHLGYRDEGMQKIDGTIQQLEGSRLFGPMEVRIIAIKRKITVFNEDRNYIGVIPLARNVLSMIDAYEKFTSGNYDAHQKESIENFRAQAYSFIAYAQARLGNLAEAKRFASLFEQSQLGKTLYGRLMIAPTWFELRETSKMLAAYDEAQQAMGGDTINDEYLLMLRCRAIVAQEQGNPELGMEYWRREAQLNNKFVQAKLESKAHEYAARYRAQEQELALQQSRAKANWLRLLYLSCLVIALLASGFAIYFFKQQRAIAAKNHVLVQQIAWNTEANVRFVQSQTLVSTSVTGHQPDAADGSWIQKLDREQLFQFLSGEIIRRRLFLDPSFSRQTVVQTFNICERLVGSVFSHSKYASLPDFIRTCRLHHACLLLENQPQMSISEIAAASGFANLSVFCRDFKNKFTVTPTVYRNERVKSHGDC